MEQYFKFNIVELDHECKVARNKVRRRRCKLRRRLALDVSLIEVADVREIIIDYLLTNRKWINMFREMCITGRSFNISELVRSSDNAFHILRIALMMTQWKPYARSNHAITHVINVLDDKYTGGISTNFEATYVEIEHYAYINERRDCLIIYMNRLINDQ